MNTITYNNIVPKSSSHSIIGSCVKVKLRKQEVGAEWIRLINSPFKQPWLSRDFDNCTIGDCSDDENYSEPFVDESKCHDFFLQINMLIF